MPSHLAALYSKKSVTESRLGVSPFNCKTARHSRDDKSHVDKHAG
jgi:hypothetical protein